MKSSKMIRCGSLFIILFMIFLMLPGDIMAAQAPVNLGTTETFAVLAGETITNTGTTTINGDAGGDVGLHPGTEFTGQASVTISGAVHLNDDVALQAKNDLIVAYDDAAGRLPVSRIPSELGGTTLTPGVYDSADGTFHITGTLTLNAENDPDGVFIFLTESTLITASGSNVSLINGARYCRIFWKVGSSATLGTDSYFVGHIFALTSITAQTRATIQGQLLARNGAVTLDTNTITNGFCEAAATPTPTETTAAETTAATPTPTETLPGETTAGETTATPTPAAPTAVPTTGAPPTTVPPAAAPPTAVPPTVTVTTETIVDTGESSNIVFVVIGIIVLGMAGSILLVVLRRSHR